MRRSSVWLQVVIGWLPVWVLFVTLIVGMHQPTTVATAAFASLRLMLVAAALGIGVAQVCARIPWPHPFRLSFIALHLVLGTAFSAAWIALNSVVESVVHRALVVSVGPGFLPFLAIGVWLYIMVAGITYATRASARAAEASALAAHAQLATLRAQLHPHFLFNALHIVVQLIPLAPERATLAAEQISDLLRTSLDEDRDLVPLSDEMHFVSRYVELQRLRFGERLLAEWNVAPDTSDMLVPSFAIQSLVENAVRHGAEPNMDATRISVSAHATGEVLTITVSDDGIGAMDAWQNAGTGLARLDQRMQALYGNAGSVHASPVKPRGFEVRLTLPRMLATE